MINSESSNSQYFNTFANIIYVPTEVTIDVSEAADH